LPRTSTGSDLVVVKLVEFAKDIHGQIVGGQKPSMKFPLCSLSNVRYTPKKGDFERGSGRRRSGPLTVSTVKTLAQTLRLVALSKRLIEVAPLNHVMDEYLPAKVKHPEKLLP
jgi:DNA topoisomerase VI subunit A